MWRQVEATLKYIKRIILVQRAIYLYEYPAKKTTKN